MVYKFFDKKSEGSRIVNNKENIQLAEELHKPIIKNFEKREMYSSFRDDIWGADLANRSYWVNLIKGLDFYYVLLIFLVNTHGLFL